MDSTNLTLIHPQSGKKAELPVRDGAIFAADFRKATATEDGAGLLMYDPGLMATASCRSSITFLDGDKGILLYRGYPIEQLAEKASFLEVAYLLLNGELPGPAEMKQFSDKIIHHTFVHESIKRFMDGFHHDAHPMGILLSTVAALSTFYPDAHRVDDPLCRRQQITRLIAKIPTLAAFAFRHRMGFPFVYPDNELGYAGNFLSMMKRMAESKYVPDPRIERALEVLFILHADHEQNCSTNAVRAVGSSRVDPYAATAAGISALWGPLHGGANEAVISMLKRIGAKDKVGSFLEGVRAGHERLMGFGHRIYKTYDPRARIIKKMADQVFEAVGSNPLLDIALELEKIALKDDYFLSRRLYPNVDFYSGMIYQALGIPTDMFPVMFAIPRTVGWLAQWEEGVTDPEQKITRPRQIYVGSPKRDYVPIEARGKNK